MTANVGIVVIGRNEGERLRVALRAAKAPGMTVVYADSGSSDGSRDLARQEGAVVVGIDEPPFTAARGRNAGIERLVGLQPQVEFVQFVDGDTALLPGWLDRGVAALAQDEGIAAVCGHLQERDAATSTWRRLMQMEWQGPAGDISACGGIAMYRRSRLDAVGRFRASLVGGEEPELCERLRAAGGRIVRIDAPMGVHDSAIDSFGAWWTRTVRVGGAFADLLANRDAKHPAHAKRAVRSAMLWGLALPLAALAGAAGAWFDVRLTAVPAAIVLLYLVQTLRISRTAARRGMEGNDAALYAASCVVGKVALVQGWMRQKLRPSRSGPSPAPDSSPRESGAEART